MDGRAAIVRDQDEKLGEVPLDVSGIQTFTGMEHHTVMRSSKTKSAKATPAESIDTALRQGVPAWNSYVGLGPCSLEIGVQRVRVFPVDLNLAEHGELHSTLLISNGSQRAGTGWREAW
jgi:hypothetical protein